LGETGLGETGSGLVRKAKGTDNKADAEIGKKKACLRGILMVTVKLDKMRLVALESMSGFNPTPG